MGNPGDIEKETDRMRKVIVIGGGAAGMMAAAAAAGKGCQVVLFEKNDKLGRKLYITGKGRCNLTNACSMEDLLGNVVGNPKFLYSAFSCFDNRKTMEWFEKAGCPLKVERGERVFPVSDHASDVIKALAGQLGRLGVQVRLRTEVKGLVTEPDGAGTVADEKMPVRLAAVKGVRLTDGTVERADAVIVATGGLSYPLTGSTGDGYRMAEETGHTVKPTFPSLVPFRVREPWCGQLQGLSLKNVSRMGKSLFMKDSGKCCLPISG